MEISIIHNKQEHKAAMSRIMALVDADPAQGTPEAEEIELLALVIGHYEKRHARPPAQLDPVDYLEFLLDQETITRKDLIRALGSAPRVSEVLGRRRQLSLAMIRRLYNDFGLPADVLLCPIAAAEPAKPTQKTARPRKHTKLAVSPAFA